MYTGRSPTTGHQCSIEAKALHGLDETLPAIGIDSHGGLQLGGEASLEHRGVDQGERVVG